MRHTAKAHRLALYCVLAVSASLLVARPGNAHAADTLVEAAVQCTLQATRLHFGRLSMQRPALVQGKGDLAVLCQNLTQETRSVELVLGFPAMGMQSATLQSGKGALPVSFFLDPQYSTPWGDGNGGAQVLQLLVRLEPNESRTLRLPVYALLRNRRDAQAGAYLILVPVRLATSPR